MARVVESQESDMEEGGRWSSKDGGVGVDEEGRGEETDGGGERER